MKNLQAKVEDFVSETSTNIPVEHRFLDAVSELGELAKEVLKETDYGKKKLVVSDKLKSEFGDAFFSMICLANQLNVNIEDEVNGVLAKYQDRFRRKGAISSGN